MVARALRPLFPKTSARLLQSHGPGGARHGRGSSLRCCAGAPSVLVPDVERFIRFIPFCSRGPGRSSRSGRVTGTAAGRQQERGQRPDHREEFRRRRTTHLPFPSHFRFCGASAAPFRLRRVTLRRHRGLVARPPVRCSLAVAMIIRRQPRAVPRSCGSGREQERGRVGAAADPVAGRGARGPARRGTGAPARPRPCRDPEPAAGHRPGDRAGRLGRARGVHRLRPLRRGDPDRRDPPRRRAPGRQVPGRGAVARRVPRRHSR